MASKTLTATHTNGVLELLEMLPLEDGRWVAVTILTDETAEEKPVGKR